MFEVTSIKSLKLIMIFSFAQNIRRARPMCNLQKANTRLRARDEGQRQ